MAERVFVHVGPPKTGTTYLQSVLWGNRAALRRAGVLVPGRAPFHHNLLATYTRSERPGPRAERVWRRVVEQVNAWPGTVVLSNEWFSLASRRQAAQMLAAFPGAEMHVVATARDFLVVAPAAWQERLKLGYGSSVDDFVASLDAPDERWSWSTLDPAQVLGRWGASLPPERIGVVTVPTSGAAPGTLWDRFASACGIPEGLCDPSTATANESLGAESARLLQLLGKRLRDAVDADSAEWTEQYRWLRRFLAHQLLVPRGGSRIALRAPDASSLRARADASADALRRAGYTVVGDLSELTSATVPPYAVHPDDVADRELLEVASGLVVELLREVRTEAHRADGEPPVRRTG
jgi:hypothetical protein